jgi:hypothetical protein
MSVRWTKEQWTEWLELVEWSHRASRQAADKLIRDAGLTGLSSGQVFNIQDVLGEAIRRGAIRLLNELNDIEETGQF